MSTEKERRELFLKNIDIYIGWIRGGRRDRILFMTSRRLRKLYEAYLDAGNTDMKIAAGTAVLNAYDENLFKRARTFTGCLKDDTKIFLKQAGRRKTIDHTDGKTNDYYSVAVIVKNEARYMREFILFYEATGADRIYIYDNDSTDDLMSVLDPFLRSGFVIYKKWSGANVQASAYRDAVRKTRHRTKWLAIVDADEYLFSPRGPMPDQLRDYEAFPGVCANWVVFGPNGHDRRPEGLIMDNYTTTPADKDAFINCHVKSIVQPEKVRSISHSHFALYKGGRYAVDEERNMIDNRNAYKPAAGRAFSDVNHRKVFRINHYITKSIEDLETKVARGYPDGSPNTTFDDQLRPFRDPLTEDHVVKRYADMIREKYYKQGR